MSISTYLAKFTLNMIGLIFQSTGIEQLNEFKKKQNQKHKTDYILPTRRLTLGLKSHTD